MSPGSRRALGSRYELIDKLGKGAMGEVWRTHDRLTGEEVAAKLLRGDLADDHDIVARFIQERAILIALDHPNIVRVRDLVVEGDDLAIVMDLVEGEDLGRLLRAQGTLRPADAVVVSAAVLDALAAAHARRCLHRDVKPDNVLLTRADDLDSDAVRLSDFSIARLADDLSVQSTGMLGTPGYMPPELIQYKQFLPTSDVYSTGVLLYQLLAGRTPFAGAGGAYAVTSRHVDSQPPRLPIEPELWSVLARMLLKDPAARLSAAETAAALRALPDTVRGSDRIPVQEEPSAWAAHEGGRTVVRSWPSGPTSGPPGSDGLRTPLTGGTGGISATGGTGGFAPPGDTTVGDRHHADRSRSRRPWAAALAASLAVAAVAVTIVLTRGSGGGADPGGGPASDGTIPVAATPAHTKDPILPTGLTVTRRATYDAADSTVTVTTTYAADDAPLRGPFLEVLPAVGRHGNCPAVVFAGAQGLVNDPVASGIGTSCAWSVMPPQVPAHGTRTVTATVSLRLGETSLQTWLQSATSGTSAALASVTTTPAYPVQRLSGLELRVIGNTRSIDLQHKALKLQVLPSWGGAPDVDDPVFDSRTFDPSAPSSILSAVAGNAKGLRFEGCPVVTVDQGWYVGVLRPGSCTLRVDVGELHASQPFVIHRLTS